MHTEELAFAKQGLLATRDWDVFQAILRKCVKRGRPANPQKKARS